MSSFITSAGENYLLSLLTAANGPYASYFVALGKEKPPTRHMTGLEMDEPTTADYSRASFINAAGNWSERDGQVTNTLDIVFPICVSEWGVIKHWALMNASTGGDLLFAGSFPTPITIAAGDQCILPAGSVTLKSTGYISRVVL